MMVSCQKALPLWIGRKLNGLFYPDAACEEDDFLSS